LHPNSVARYTNLTSYDELVRKWYPRDTGRVLRSVKAVLDLRIASSGGFRNRPLPTPSGISESHILQCG